MYCKNLTCKKIAEYLYENTIEMYNTYLMKASKRYGLRPQMNQLAEFLLLQPPMHDIKPLQAVLYLLQELAFNAKDMYVSGFHRYDNNVVYELTNMCNTDHQLLVLIDENDDDVSLKFSLPTKQYMHVSYL